MALPVQQQLRYWGIAIVVLAVILWAVGDVLLPFVVGGAIAYLSDPIADRLERWHLSRVTATIVIALGALVVFTLISLLLIPTLVSQATDLFKLAPEIARNVQGFLTETFPSLQDENSPVRRALLGLGEMIQSRAGELINSVVTSALSVINVVVFIVVTPVVAVYLLLDWDRMIATIDDLLPRDHAPVIRQLASEIDTTLSAFVRGMGTVCLILGTYYAVALMIVGLNFGLVVGFIAGLITFIPYLGALIGGALAIGLALFQFWGDWPMIGVVVGIFVVGQMAEGNVLTPKLVGSSVGLHPVWLLLALSVFGGLFGFVGMLIAVPLAATLGVLARYGLGQYKGGKLYRGISGQDDA